MKLRLTAHLRHVGPALALGRALEVVKVSGPYLSRTDRFMVRVDVTARLRVSDPAGAAHAGLWGPNVLVGSMPCYGKTLIGRTLLGGGRCA